MKGWKKILAILCASAMTVSMVGCSSSSSDTSEDAHEEVESTDTTEDAQDQDSTQESDDTQEESSGYSGEVRDVVVAFPTIYELSGVQEVEDAINEITEEKYGIHFDLNFISYGNYDTQVNLLLTGDEVDVLHVSYLQNYYNNGQIASLQAYYDEASEELQNLVSEDIWDGLKIKGELYGMPKLVDYGHYIGLNIDEDIAAEYGIEDRQELTMEEVDEFLAWCAENYPDRYPLAPSGTQILGGTGWTWDSLGDFIGVLPDCGQTSTTVESIMDNEDYLEAAQWCRKWYQAGYVTSDILSNTEAAETKVQNDQACAYFDSYGVNNVSGMIRTMIVDHWTDSATVASGSYVINANSSDIDAAWEAMEILYLDEEVGYYLYNGIEGRDYVLNDDGTMSYPDGYEASTVPYGTSNLYWCMPWAGNGGIPLQINGATFYEDLAAYNNEGYFSLANGFSFDSSTVIDEYTACLNVVDKYYDTLLSGAVDVESTVEKAKEEFAAAGIDIVIAEKQAQLDEFLASK